VTAISGIIGRAGWVTSSPGAKANGAEALILSAGWDAHRDDPISKLTVSTDAYARTGELYGRRHLPTLIV